MDFTASLRLIHANFFFVDIVGLSDISMSTKTQIKKIETLNKCISDCTSFKSVPLDSLLLLPTGDGCCIGFMQGPELPCPVECSTDSEDVISSAKMLSEKLKLTNNKAEIPTSKFLFILDIIFS